MPLVPHVTPGAVVASTWGNLVADHTVMRFTTAAQRTSQLPSPILNQLSLLDTRNVLQYWNGAAWVDLATGESPTGGARRVFARYAAQSTNATGDITVSWPAGTFASVPDQVQLTNATAGTPLHFAINPGTLTVTSVQFRVFTAAGAGYNSQAVNFYYLVSGPAA